MKHSILSFTVAFFVTGCSVMTAPTNVENNILVERKSMLDGRDYQHKASNVVHFDTMYVEPLTEAQAVLPRWYYKKVDSTFSGMPLDRALRKILKDLAVNVEYRPGIDRSTEVHINRENLSIGEVLDSISGSTGYQYTVSDTSIVLKKFDTRYYEVRMPLGGTQYSIGKKKLKGEQRQQGGQNTATADLMASAGEEYSVISGKHNMLFDMMSGIKVILGCQKKGEDTKSDNALTSNTEQSTTNTEEEGESICDHDAIVKLMPSDNTLMVKAIPSQHDAVKTFISKKTELALRQVRVNISLMSVEISKDTQLNLDVDLTDANLLGSVGVETITTAANTMLGGLDPTGKTTLKHKNGSTLAIDALNKQGTILKRIIMRGTSMNHRVTQLTSINKVNYVASRELQTTANVGATTGIEQKVAESGSILYILPNIGESDVVLHVSTSQSALTRLDIKGSEENQVESPVIDDKFLNTTVRVRPGKPIFIGGFSANELKAIFAESGLTPPGLNRGSVDTNIETVMMVDVEFL